MQILPVSPREVFTTFEWSSLGNLRKARKTSKREEGKAAGMSGFVVPIIRALASF